MENRMLQNESFWGLFITVTFALLFAVSAMKLSGISWSVIISVLIGAFIGGYIIKKSSDLSNKDQENK